MNYVFEAPLKIIIHNIRVSLLVCFNVSLKKLIRIKITERNNYWENETGRYVKLQSPSLVHVSHVFNCTRPFLPHSFSFSLFRPLRFNQTVGILFGIISKYNRFFSNLSGKKNSKWFRHSLSLYECWSTTAVCVLKVSQRRNLNEATNIVDINVLQLMLY